MYILRNTLRNTCIKLIVIINCMLFDYIKIDAFKEVPTYNLVHYKHAHVFTYSEHFDD